MEESLSDMDFMEGSLGLNIPLKGDVGGYRF